MVSAIEVSEGGGQYKVRAELAGFNPGDVRLEIGDGGLTVQGERKSVHEKKTGEIRRTEISYGRLFRRIPIPEGATIDQARARFDNGVLEITVPVPERNHHPRQIPIQKRPRPEAAPQNTGDVPSRNSEGLRRIGLALARSVGLRPEAMYAFAFAGAIALRLGFDLGPGRRLAAAQKICTPVSDHLEKELAVPALMNQFA